MTKPFEKKTYYAMTLDPVHVGTGGYRLGRVDNTIVREPGTNLPKIPGSSISGATRAYTAMAVQSENPIRMKYLGPPKSIEITKSDGSKEQKIVHDSCAGKGGESGDSHCGKEDCEVCVPFGFSQKSGSSFQGLAQCCDARILFFPVSSMIGPVWVTSESILKEHNITCSLTDKQKLKSFALTAPGNKLNFGWLMLELEAGTVSLNGHLTEISSDIRDRLVLVSDKLFSRIVNDNLEVRTSVAINPATGAAEDGALYTYEAIPRATVMWFDIVYNKPDYFKINADKAISLSEPVNYLDPLRTPSLKDQIGFMAFNVEKGLNYFEALGFGGMGTRGMGRMKVLNLGRQ
jgi:CRISPR-associated protein Cmr4